MSIGRLLVSLLGIPIACSAACSPYVLREVIRPSIAGKLPAVAPLSAGLGSNYFVPSANLEYSY